MGFTWTYYCNYTCCTFIFCLSAAIAHETEPTRDIRCEFCGEYFENRKGLSSHARSHLRQMGITEWSVNGSPIDTLREVMHKRGLEPSSDQGVKKESSQDPSSPSWESAAEPGCAEGRSVSSFQTSKLSKPPLGLLQSGPRLHKQGLTSLTAHAVSSTGKFFRISPLGRRPQQFDEARSRGTERSPPPPPPPRQQPRTFSPQLHDFSFKRKASPDKHGHRGKFFFITQEVEYENLGQASFCVAITKAKLIELVLCISRCLTR